MHKFFCLKLFSMVLLCFRQVLIRFESSFQLKDIVNAGSVGSGQIISRRAYKLLPNW